MKTINSHDSKKIKSLSLKYGADKVRLRPNKYSTAKSSTISVILDYLRNELKENKNIRKYIAILPLTNPFLTIQTIKKSFKKLQKSKHANSLVSVTESKIHPFLFLNLKKKS